MRCWVTVTIPVDVPDDYGAEDDGSVEEWLDDEVELVLGSSTPYEIDDYGIPDAPINSIT